MKMDLFKQMILDFQGRALPKFVKRDHELSLIKDISISVSGPRRAGKTYRTYQFIREYLDDGNKIENICRIQFNNNQLKLMKSEELQLINESYYALYPEKQDKEEVLFIFDEIHRVDGWEDYILFLLDNQNHKVLITGSTSKLQKGNFASALRGKNLDRELLPFSFAEFMRFYGVDDEHRTSKGSAYCQKMLLEYLHQGAFPGLLEMDRSMHSELLESYWNTMLIKDISEAHKDDENIDIVQLEMFALFLISRIACPMTVRKIVINMREASYPIAPDKAQKYLKFLEEAFMIFTVSFYSNSEKVRNRNYRKVYAIDWALGNSIALGEGIDITRQFENLVFIELKRRKHLISYYKTECGYEIDFVIQDNKRRESPDIIQVCYELSSKEVLERELRAIEKSYQFLKAKSAIIITMNEERKITRDKVEILVIPIWKWLLNRKR